MRGTLEDMITAFENRIDELGGVNESLTENRYANNRKRINEKIFKSKAEKKKEYAKTAEKSFGEDTYFLDSLQDAIQAPFNGILNFYRNGNSSRKEYVNSGSASSAKSRITDLLK